MRIDTGQIVVAAAAAFLALGAAPALADVRSGVEAWQRGDFTGAVKQWRALADRGDADAQFNMGQAYKLGRGAPADLKIAQSWYQKAAAQGHEQAQANLGLILFQSGDRKAAMPWIKKAAAAGDPRAQYVLGTTLFNGDLVGRDWPQAYALMTRAAAQGLPQAASSLTQMDQYIPLPDRQKGIAIARQMESGVPVRVAAAPVPTIPAKAPRVAGRVPTAPAAQLSTPAPVAARAPVATAAVSAGGKWRAQLGAYGSVAAAQAQWATLSRKISGAAGLVPSYEKAGVFTRLRVGPLANRAAADRICASAKAAGQACFPVAP